MVPVPYVGSSDSSYLLVESTGLGFETVTLNSTQKSKTLLVYMNPYTNL